LVKLGSQSKLQEFESGKFYVRADMCTDEQAKQQNHWEGRKWGSNSDK